MQDRPLDSTTKEIRRGTRMLAADARRSADNINASGRLLILVLITSIAMGFAAWAFLTALDLVTEARQAHRWLFAMLPVVGVGTAWLYRSHGLQAARGNNLVIDSALTGRLIHARMALLTFFCSIATHLVGGSAGREGTAVQIGGTIASNVSQAFKLGERDHHDLVLAGVSAAFGGVFGTPLAGAFFGMEMCYVGKLDYSSALYCLFASFTADMTAQALGIRHGMHAIGNIPSISLSSIALAAGAAVVFGLVARAFSAWIRAIKRFYSHRFTSYLAAALASSLVLLAAYALFGAWNYAGLSEWLVDAGFAGTTSAIDPIAKLALTALTLGAGFQGGEVTPLFGIGASLGGWLGASLGVDPSFFAALGMVGVFGAALNVPVTTIMLGIDLFGGRAAGYFVIVSFISYLVAGHRGIYPAQRIVTPKRRSLAQDEDLTVDQAIARHHEAAERAARDADRKESK